MGLAADGAVFDVVGDAVLELVEDFSEVGAVAPTAWAAVFSRVR